MEDRGLRMLLMRSNSGWRVLALAVIFPFGVGCGLGAPQASDDYLSPNVRQQVLDSVQALSYPFDSDPLYAVRIANLQTRLINSCVAAQGVTPPRVADIPVTSAEMTPSWLRMWVVVGDDYGIADALSDPKVVADLVAGSDQFPAEGIPPDPDAYDRAVYGESRERIEIQAEDGLIVSIPVAGCFGEATKTMYGVPTAEEYERAYYAIPSIRTVKAEFLADPSVRRAAQGWSRCMSEQDHPADLPDGLFEYVNRWVGNVLSGQQTISEIAAEERALAQVDQHCRTASGLGTVATSRFLEISRAEIRGKEGAVQEYRRMIEHAQNLIAEGV